MKIRKFLTLFVITFLICTTFFTLNVYAEEANSEVPSRLPEHISQFLKDMEANNADCTIEFTSDSADCINIYYEVGYDELKEQLYFEIISNLPSGYAIYDVPETPYLDGVKINDTFLATPKLPYKYYLTDPTVSYTILVKTVYTEGMAGTLAKIQDGKANILDLFESPAILAQSAYYVLALVTLMLSFILTARGKKYKAKTSQEIANGTANAVAETGAQTKSELIDTVRKEVLEKIIPLVEACLRSNQNVVKAVAVSNSKAKDAPLTVLDILNDNSKINIEDVIDSLKEHVTAKLNLDEEKHNNVKTIVHAIAENVTDRIVREDKEAVDTPTEDQASVF